MNPGTLLVRADATVASGTGHVMRSLALAQAWRRCGGEVVFAMAQSTAAIVTRLRDEKMQLIAIDTAPGSADDLRQTASTAILNHSRWIVLDGYHFNAEYVSRLQAACPLLLIDDNAELDFYAARFVLNQNLHATEKMYEKRMAHTRLLLGPRYTLLREEFTPYRNWSRTISQRGERVLITMGGSDPKDLAPGIVSALGESPLKDLQIRVVVGGSAGNRDAVAEVANRFPGQVEVLSDVTNMAGLMAWADVAIAGAGTTCWEMCLLALPAVLIVVAENQRGIAEHLANVGAAINTGPADSQVCSSVAQITSELLENHERRLQMSQAARQLVDGLGNERVRAALQERELNLRIAQDSDCQLLFEWASDAVSRSASFRGDAISWEEHTRWFTERLRDDQSMIFIGENANGDPVGLVRFQTQDRSAILSVNVASKFRGQGWGRELIVFATNSFASRCSVRKIEAFVKPENHASLRLFEVSGFNREGIEQVSGQDAFRFTLEVGNKINVS